MAFMYGENLCTGTCCGLRVATRNTHIDVRSLDIDLYTVVTCLSLGYFLGHVNLTLETRG